MFCGSWIEFVVGRRKNHDMAAPRSALALGALLSVAAAARTGPSISENVCGRFDDDALYTSDSCGLYDRRSVREA